MLRLIIFSFLSILFIGNLFDVKAQSPTPTPKSKDTSKAAKREEKKREKEEKNQAEKYSKEQKEENKQRTKFEEARPINRTSSYDRFKDLTFFSMDKMLLVADNDYLFRTYGIASISLTGSYYIQGTNWKKPEQVILQFEVLEAGWQFRNSDNRNLILLVDGERVNLSAMGQEEFNVPHIGNLEKLFVRLRYDDFAKIANANIVEAQLGVLELAFHQRHLQGLRNLIGISEDEKNTIAISETQPKERSDDVLSVGSVINLATYRVNPIYSKVARKANIIGVVKVEVLIDETGSVISATGISGESMLMESALEAVKQWKFKPFIVSGKSEPVKVRGIVNFNFSL